MLAEVKQSHKSQLTKSISFLRISVKNLGRPHRQRCDKKHSSSGVATFSIQQTQQNLLKANGVQRHKTSITSIFGLNYQLKRN